MNGDLERADFVVDDDDRHYKDGKDSKNATTTTGDNSALVAAWMHRLQMLTLITSFLAAIDGQLFNTASAMSVLEVTIDASMRSKEIVCACFSGAFVFHICASILGYIACFVLVRYEISEAAATSGLKIDDLGKLSNHGLHNTHGRQLLFRPISAVHAVKTLFRTPSNIKVESRTSAPPLDLLTRCYYTTLALSCVGFISALIGIGAYAWYGLRQAIGIFTTVCLGIGVMSGVWAVL